MVVEQPAPSFAGQLCGGASRAALPTRNQRAPPCPPLCRPRQPSDSRVDKCELHAFPVAAILLHSVLQIVNISRGQSSYYT